MAMTMTGENILPADRATVWAKLNDPEVLKACIPGCEELERTQDNGFRAVAKVKVGPVKATFKGKVVLSDIDEPNGYTITGEGEGGVAGFAKGGAKVQLSEVPEGTKLTYDVEALRVKRLCAGLGLPYLRIGTDYAPGDTARIGPGPRSDWFDGDPLGALTDRPLTVTASSRVGVRLRGPVLVRRRGDELPSEGLVRGAIQVPPDGEPIMMLADHPTTGGYPVVAVVHPDDVATVAQRPEGTTVRLRL